MAEQENKTVNKQQVLHDLLEFGKKNGKITMKEINHAIDALELGMAVKKAFGVTFSSDAAENRKVFRSVKTLADFIESQQKA